MNLDDRLSTRRLAFEARADKLFEAAWAGVQTLAQPVKFELDLLREPSGCWRDFFAHTAYPALDLPLLLLEDLGLADEPARTQVEEGLVAASALSATAVLVSELLQVAECHVKHEHGLLGHGLLVQEQWQLAAVAGTGDMATVAAWALSHWNEHDSAMLDHRIRMQQRTEPYTPQDLAHAGRRWAPLKTSMFVAAVRAGQPGLLASLGPLLDEAQSLYQLGRELGSLSRDLSRGHCSYPVWRLAQVLGGMPVGDAPPDADHDLLAAMLTPTLRDIATDAVTRLEALRAALRRLGLGQVSRALARLGDPFDQLLAICASASRPADATGRASFSLSYRPQREGVIAAARGYLRGDPACHEAWEVYRWGYLNEAELVCRVFPLGFLLEHRIAAGDDCAADVDELVALYARNRHHYFDTMSLQPPDFDTLGLVLRLVPHAADPARCAALLEQPLRWLLDNIGPHGEIPVFMTQGFDADTAGPYVHVIGRYCAAVQAGVLLGLLAFDARRFHALVVRASRHTLHWFARCGAGSLRCYDLPYAAGMLLALCDGLRCSDAAASLHGEIEAAEQQALDLLTAWRALGRITPQDAALIELASHFPAAGALRDPAWAEQLIRTQHNDGSWDASPLYVIPCRGNLMNWHVSRLATSALAFRALAEPHRKFTRPDASFTGLLDPRSVSDPLAMGRSHCSGPGPEPTVHLR